MQIYFSGTPSRTSHIGLCVTGLLGLQEEATLEISLKHPMKAHEASEMMVKVHGMHANEFSEVGQKLNPILLCMFRMC